MSKLKTSMLNKLDANFKHKESGSGKRSSKVNSYSHQELFFQLSGLKSDEVFRSVASHPKGLVPSRVLELREEFGVNEVIQDKPRWQAQIFRAMINPFIILLTVLAIVSYLTDDAQGSIVMAVMVVVSVTLTFFQEYRSSLAAEKLKNMVRTTATVVRRIGQLENEPEEEWVSRKIDIPISELVRGDLIALSAGDMIPADVRLITSKDLFVSQSSMTGESLPVEKSFNEELKRASDLPNIKNICFMGSNVVSGAATAVVVKTGTETYLGSIAKSVVGNRVQTSFDKGINQFTWMMLRFMFVMVPFVFLVNGLTKHNWTEAFMFAVAVAVGLTPEMLPMIVTVNLAKGAIAMSKKKVIVKRLNSIQNLGAMDVLCTDKTGTLTQDKVVLEKYIDVAGAPSDRVLKYAYLNSFYQTGLKNLLDIAILKHRELSSELDIDRIYRKLDEIPFDFNRRRMSVVVEKLGRRHILICKGALEEMLKNCTHGEIGRELVALDAESIETCTRIAQDLNSDGLRVIAVAYKDVAAQDKKEYAVADESGLILLGFVAFYDPPKETAALAIRNLAKHGVAVKVLTGDNDRVARKVAAEVGLAVDEILLGGVIDDMSDDELDNVVQRITLFAKLTPAQKERIVHSLHRKDHVVGFMGDGINDAPALKAADVGISVDNAVDIAKESADIILLEKSLLVLEDGVIEGRKVFGNIIKYVRMGASSNFGNMFSMLGASAILPFLPMAPVQLLSQNLLYDISQIAIPFDEVDKEYTEKPRRWEIKNISRFMLFIGPISSIFDYATFAVMWFVFKADTPAQQGLFQSGWFIEGLLSQTLVVHMIRTRHIPFVQSRASWPLIVMTSLIMIIGVMVPFSIYGRNIGLTPLPMSYFPWLAGILLSYCFLTQIVKNWFAKLFGYN
jgi:Mg2+-importing ATPase